MGRRIVKQGTDWNAMFMAVNELAMKEFGEDEWGGIVEAAGSQRSIYKVPTRTVGDEFFFALGLYLGAFYQKHIGNVHANELRGNPGGVGEDAGEAGTGGAEGLVN